MKPPLVHLFLACLATGSVVLPLAGQISPAPLISPISTVGGIVTVGGPAAPVVQASLANQTAPVLNLTPTESQRVFTAAVSNSGSKPMSVLGVQTTPGLFVVQSPTTIPAAGSAPFTLLYYAQNGVASTSDVLRVLTDQGLIAVEIDHGRAPAAQMSPTSLQWQLGETGSKSVTLSVSGAVPVLATALGAGNSAQITPAGAGSYTITVTPGSTAKAQSFSVIVQLKPALPDVLPVVTCTIGSDE